MPDTSLNLDHVAVVVKDMDDSYKCYTKLGFQLTRRSSHKGPATPGGEVELWGTGNHCAMFGQGYLEVLGVTDPDRNTTHVDPLLAKYEGLHLVAFGCEDAAGTVDRLKQNVQGLDAPVTVRRDVPFDNSTRPGGFSIAQLDNDLYPEADFFLIEHQTPEILWQKSLLGHPNGAISLVSTTICTPDPTMTLERLAPILGSPASGGFVLDRGRLDIVDPDEFSSRFPGAQIPPPPCAASLCIGVGDLGRAEALLVGNGVPCNRTAQGKLWVHSEYCNGAIVEFSAT